VSFPLHVINPVLEYRKVSIYMILIFHLGNAEADQVLSVLLSTSMFVGGVVGFLLDNTVPGKNHHLTRADSRLSSKFKFHFL
jgi:hypothetical protein